jgi:tRNA dimethylallyltransferase
VEKMVDAGLVEEARKYHDYRDINALNTVGYKEIFQYLDGNITLERAKELIKRDTRRYAKRQITWFKRDKEIEWFHPCEFDQIYKYIKDHTE